MCIHCRAIYSKWSGKSIEERIASRRATVPVVEGLRARLMFKSGNKKLGGIPTSITSRSSCPPSCSFYNSGCYAEHHVLAYHWKNVGSDGDDWDTFCRDVSQLAHGQLWRHNTAGDLPGDGTTVDVPRLVQLMRAAGHTRPFTFSHYYRSEQGLLAIRTANATGFVVNLSADSLAEADRLAELGAGPVAVVIPSGTLDRSLRTPAGRKVVVCPAQTDAHLTCAQCALCAVPGRKSIIAFRAHGQSVAIVDHLIQLRRPQIRQPLTVLPSHPGPAREILPSVRPKTFHKNLTERERLISMCANAYRLYEREERERTALGTDQPEESLRYSLSLEESWSERRFVNEVLAEVRSGATLAVALDRAYAPTDKLGPEDAPYFPSPAAVADVESAEDDGEGEEDAAPSPDDAPALNIDRLPLARASMRLKEEDVRKMRELRVQGVTINAIAERFAISDNLAADVCAGRAWRHIPLPAGLLPGVTHDHKPSTRNGSLSILPASTHAAAMARAASDAPPRGVSDGPPLREPPRKPWGRAPGALNTRTLALQPKVLAMHAEGQSVRAIVAVTKLSKGTVEKLVPARSGRDAAIMAHDKNGHSETAAAMRAERAAGASIRDIATKYDVSMGHAISICEGVASPHAPPGAPAPYTRTPDPALPTIVEGPGPDYERLDAWLRERPDGATRSEIVASGVVPRDAVGVLLNRLVSDLRASEGGRRFKALYELPDGSITARHPSRREPEPEPEPPKPEPKPLGLSSILPIPPEVRRLVVEAEIASVTQPFGPVRPPQLPTPSHPKVERAGTMRDRFDEWLRQNHPQGVTRKQVLACGIFPADSADTHLATMVSQGRLERAGHLFRRTGTTRAKAMGPTPDSVEKRWRGLAFLAEHGAVSPKQMMASGIWPSRKSAENARMHWLRSGIIRRLTDGRVCLTAKGQREAALTSPQKQNGEDGMKEESDRTERRRRALEIFAARANVRPADLAEVFQDRRSEQNFCSYGKASGLLRSVSRGVFAITSKGRSELARLTATGPEAPRRSVKRREEPATKVATTAHKSSHGLKGTTTIADAIANLDRDITALEEQLAGKRTLLGTLKALLP